MTASLNRWNRNDSSWRRSRSDSRCGQGRSREARLQSFHSSRRCGGARNAFWLGFEDWRIDGSPRSAQPRSGIPAICCPLPNPTITASSPAEGRVQAYPLLQPFWSHLVVSRYRVERKRRSPQGTAERLSRFRPASSGGFEKSNPRAGRYPERTPALPVTKVRGITRKHQFRLSLKALRCCFICFCGCKFLYPIPKTVVVVMVTVN